MISFQRRVRMKFPAWASQPVSDAYAGTFLMQLAKDRGTEAMKPFSLLSFLTLPRTCGSNGCSQWVSNVVSKPFLQLLLSLVQHCPA